MRLAERQGSGLDIIRLMRPPAAIPAFDHRPTDDELSVWVKRGDLITSDVRVRRDGDQLLVEMGRIPIVATVVWLGVVIAVGGFFLGFDKARAKESAYFAFLVPMVFFGLWLLFDWFNRTADRMNPLVCYDPSRRTLRIYGRDEPLDIGAIEELVIWSLSFKQMKAAGLNPYGSVCRQTSVVVRCGDGYETVLLFHDLGGRAWLWRGDPPRTLAEALHVPVREIVAT